MPRTVRSLPELAAQALGGERSFCKCCSGLAPLFGRVDFNKSCMDHDGPLLPPAGIPVPYFRCSACGFLFTRFFDHWTLAEFEAHVYNQDYAQVDPEYAAKRPDDWAQALDDLLGGNLARVSLLDWGGGTGRLAQQLRARGIGRAETWEPFNAAFTARPQGDFNMVTCIEVLEHLPDPRIGLKELIGFLPGEGALVLSTLLQPEDIEAAGTAWWYLAPRNGHISLFSRTCLEGLLREHGFRLVVLQPSVHLAWRVVPAYLEPLVGR